MDSVAVTLYVQSGWCPLLYMYSFPLRYAANYGAGQILVPVRTARHQYGGTACQLTHVHTRSEQAMCTVEPQVQFPSTTLPAAHFPKFTSYVIHATIHRTLQHCPLNYFCYFLRLVS